MRFQFIAIMLFAALTASAQSPATPPSSSAAPSKAAQHNSPARKASPSAANSTETSAISRRVEKYIRNLYAWGPQFKLKLGEPVPTPVAGLLQISIEMKIGNDSSTGQLFVSSDGRYVFQGDLGDMTADPFADTRRKMQLKDAPSSGPADARVVVVEYGDFQCPSCRQLQQIIKALRPNYPPVRFVFRDFPLTQIHAWAMTASLGGRCVLAQNPAAFWTYYDTIYEGQDLIKPENVWDRMKDEAATLGLDQDAFKTCMAAPETKQAVDASVQEGIALKIANTPTVFVNGRRLVGGDRESLEQFIQYELAATQRPGPAAKPTD